MTAVGATREDLTGVIDELMTSVPEVDIVLLLSEREPGLVSGSLRTAREVSAVEVAALFGGGGHPGAAGFQLLDATVEGTIRGVLEKIVAYQDVRLGLVAPAGTVAAV